MQPTACGLDAQDTAFLRRVVSSVVRGRRFDVENLVGEARMAAWIAAERFDGRGAARAFVIRQARFRVIDALRRLRRPPESASCAWLDEAVAREMPAFVEDRDFVAALLRALAPREAAGLRGYYLESKSMRRVGSDLGMTEAGASRLLGRALVKARRWAEKEMAA